MDGWSFTLVSDWLLNTFLHRRAVDFIPHHLHWKCIMKGSLNDYSKKNTSLFIWAPDCCWLFMTDLNNCEPIRKSKNVLGMITTSDFSEHMDLWILYKDRLVHEVKMIYSVVLKLWWPVVSLFIFSLWNRNRGLFEDLRPTVCHKGLKVSY